MDKSHIMSMRQIQIITRKNAWVLVWDANNYPHYEY